MDVIIKEIASTVRLTGGDPLMDAETFQTLVAAVVEAIEARRERDCRRAEERRVTPGSTDWMRRGGGR